MSVSDRLLKLRSWFPVPTAERRPGLIRWLLLEGNRYAVTGALLSLTFASTLLIGSIWTFEMQGLLTDTQAVQMVLNAFLGGIILLVSIVVSINSIILSHDITSVGNQEERIEGIVEFRQEVGRLAGTDETPTDPSSFLQTMSRLIEERARAISNVDEGMDEEYADDIGAFVGSISETAEQLDSSLHHSTGGQFRALWVGLETDYGLLMNRMRDFVSTYRDQLSESEKDQLDELIHLFELFATGQEYFKTLYYSREIIDLSRTLLIISLPSIIITAWAILAINANIFPTFWVFGLPPLLSFVAFIFTVALAPFLVLTSFMLRVATVTLRTATTGPFVLES